MWCPGAGAVFREDDEIRAAVTGVVASAHWPEADRRFDRILEELRADREGNTRRWEENDRKWHEQHEEIMALDRRLESSITAAGARWGLRSESSSRNGLRAVLESSFGIKVENVVEFDEQGEVYGRPDQVELDVVLHDGTLVLMELKSSMSRSDMYVFERKVRFYEKRKGRKADRRIVISPMIEPRAAEIAMSFRIECYTDSYNVEEL